LVIIGGRKLLDRAAPDIAGPLGAIVNFLLNPGMIRLPGGMTILLAYPLLPWFGSSRRVLARGSVRP